MKMKFLVPALALSIGLAACGGGDDEGSADDPVLDVAPGVEESGTGPGNIPARTDSGMALPDSAAAAGSRSLADSLGAP